MTCGPAADASSVEALIGYPATAQQLPLPVLFDQRSSELTFIHWPVAPQSVAHWSPRFPERFAGVVVANTGLPVGTPASDGFKQWLAFSRSTPDMPVGQIAIGR